MNGEKKSKPKPRLAEMFRIPTKDILYVSFRATPLAW